MARNGKNPKYPGIKVTTNGNLLVSDIETLAAEAGVFYPITPSTEMGENFQNSYAKGELNAFGKSLVAIETEGEHAAQGGAIAMSVTGKRVVNFTSGQGIVYGLEQYFHAPGKLSTMVLEVGARALTKHALNVHCGHDDVYSTLDTGWNVTFSKNAQQAVDQALILRKVNELSLNPGLNAQDGFLTTHLERSFLKPETALIREFLGASDDIIDCPTEAQRKLFGPTRRRVPKMIDLENPILLGPVQNQEHYMNGVAARRNNFSEHILKFFEDAYEEYGKLTGRHYGLVSEYNTENADTVFVSLGSSAENIEAAVDYIKQTRNEEVGVIHINVIRPFPMNAVIKALRGKKRVIILERTDEPMSTENPLTRDIKVSLSKAANNFRYNSHAGLEKLDPGSEMPMIFSGVYGLGSRDFRPEGVIGAYDFAMGRIARTDGKKVSDGVNFFYVGIDHPYAVLSEETPSCLPENSIAIRFHSVGGWGMITTGKNLGSILGEISKYTAKRDGLFEPNGDPMETIHTSANPKYGSEKKGAPTNYFLVAAHERVRVNCDLNHVNAVLCCDPKAFLHTNPLSGLEEGGAFVWESSEETPDKVWQRIPKRFRQEIIDKNIRVYALNGFKIAKAATQREDLQTRMQGNSFLGSFFSVSPLLEDYGLGREDFLTIVKNQYLKKFGRFGDKVVDSNMAVMQRGFEEIMEVSPGKVDDPDTSAFMGDVIHPCMFDFHHSHDENGEKAPMFKMETFDEEFRAGLGYNQPSSPLSSVGMMASGTGATASKYVSRRQVPIYLAENCTQCMECMVVCPDSAMPSTAQEISSILSASIRNYVTNEKERQVMLFKVADIERGCRKDMLERVSNADQESAFRDIAINNIRKECEEEVSAKSLNEVASVLKVLPLAFEKTKQIFANREKKEEGSGGIFGIFINDLCKGCAACVEACGKHEALVMVPETEDIHAQYETNAEFLDLLRDTPSKFLGILDSEHPLDSKAAALKYHLMIQSKYKAFAAGDGACAGCGEKSVLKSVSTLTETLMKPLFTQKAERLYEKASKLEKSGAKFLKELKALDEESYKMLRLSILHLVGGLGGSNLNETRSIIDEKFKGDDAELIQVLIKAMQVDAEKHIDHKSIQEIGSNGMSVMAMTAHTGCNTVYGSTPPNNPHPYPWMNSLFQDGATIGWLIGESFIKDHATLSIIPERLADILLEGTTKSFTEDDYFSYTHFTDLNMTDEEIMELPKIWAIGGDGGMGDIGFQNVSKVVLQNRPNINLLMLDTQVYSNTGGQNSDSSPMTGGFDMNQAGKATEGKLTEMKSVSEAFLAGHGSPYVAQVSAANIGNLYRSILEGLTYRGTSYFQIYTTCQPEHGVPDYAAQGQSLLARDSRGMPEFVFNPMLGESYQETLDIKANTSFNKDWVFKYAPVTKEKYQFMIPHWAFSENRFRFHHKVVSEDETQNMVSLEAKLKLIMMDDVVHRRYLNPEHRSYVEDFGVYVVDYTKEGTKEYHSLSRQMVIFCVERRKAWRLLQSRAGIENEDYREQRELIKQIDSGDLSVDEFLNNSVPIAENSR